MTNRLNTPNSSSVLPKASLNKRKRLLVRSNMGQVQDLKEEIDRHNKVRSFMVLQTKQMCHLSRKLQKPLKSAMLLSGFDQREHVADESSRLM